MDYLFTNDSHIQTNYCGKHQLSHLIQWYHCPLQKIFVGLSIQIFPGERYPHEINDGIFLLKMNNHTSGGGGDIVVGEGWF